MPRRITLYVTGKNAEDAADNGLIWDDVDDAREYVEEQDPETLRVYSFSLPLNLRDATLKPFHSQEVAEALAEEIPEGARSMHLTDSLHHYGLYSL